MPSDLKQRLNDHVKDALRAGDKRRLGALRLIMAAIKQKEVDERIDLSDTQVLAILDKMAKQRKESMTLYQQAGRSDLAEQETFELQLIQSYMPTPLSDEEIRALIDKAIVQSGASRIADLGKVMAILKPELQGRADLSQVSILAKQRLTS
jgi:uncharacterized protein YqeY